MNRCYQVSTGVNQEYHWYAVHTRPKAEKHVAGMLEKKGIECYCPIQKTVRSWSDRKKTVLEPVFKNYVFLRVDPLLKWSVLSVPGVFNYVMADKKPAVIRDAEMEVLMNFLNDYPEASIVENAIVANQHVRIVKGIFANQEGVVRKVVGNRVKVYINSLGIVIQATLPLDVLEPARANMDSSSA